MIPFIFIFCQMGTFKLIMTVIALTVLVFLEQKCGDTIKKIMAS